jgi:N-acetylmuramoyl-L-alanine amidase
MATAIEASALLYAFYMLFLRRTNAYGLHRFYLLLALLISFVLPFVQIEIAVKNLPLLHPKNILPVVHGFFEEQIAGSGTTAQSTLKPGFLHVFSCLFFGGMLLSLLRVGLQVIAVLKVLASCKRQVFETTIVFTSENIQHPFSFAGKIIIPSTLLQQQKDLQMIIAHEAEHSQRNHHSDLLIYTLCQVVNWWNPVVYLIRRQLIIVHEFEADSAVVSQFDRSMYATLLLTATFNVSKPVITHSFFQSPIKLRIMRFYENKKKSSVHRFWFALPVIAFITFLFCVSFVPGNKSSPVKTYKIVIDPGHGGIDAGVSQNGITEKDITLKIARLMAKEATEVGIEVVMTRTGDELPVPGDKNASLKQRVETVKSANPDVLVMIHAGAADDNYNGTDAYVSANENKLINLSKTLATSILDNLQKGPLKVNMQIKQRKGEGIWVLDKSPVPSVLLELGYLTSNEDFKILMNDDNLRKIASLIVKGIKSYSTE